jgi:hypothetical protein
VRCAQLINSVLTATLVLKMKTKKIPYATKMSVGAKLCKNAGQKDSHVSAISVLQILVQILIILVLTTIVNQHSFV